MTKPDDCAEMVGRRFGCLTVERVLEEREACGALRYSCRCDCGKSAVKAGTFLRYESKIGRFKWLRCRDCVASASAAGIGAYRAKKHTIMLDMWERTGSLYAAREEDLSRESDWRDDVIDALGFDPSRGER
jgi:hypothetical protein